MKNSTIDVLSGQINLVTRTDTTNTNNYEHGQISNVSVIKDALVISYHVDDDNGTTTVHMPLNKKGIKKLYQIFYSQIGYQTKDGVNHICFNHLISRRGIFTSRKVIGNGNHACNHLIDFVFDTRFKTDYEVEVDLENGYYDIPGCIPDLIDDEIN